MDIKECYEEMHGNYDDVMGRLGKEERIRKFLLKFLENTDFREMEAAYEIRDWSRVFFHAHNLKGMGLNLGLSRLQELSGKLCEMVRNGEPTEDPRPVFHGLKASYEETVEAIAKLKQP